MSPFILFLPDPAYDFSNGAYQEMKAEVTEVPASHLLPEINQNFTGKVWAFLMMMFLLFETIENI